MVKRKLFDEFGGFDENFRVAYGDIDFCLRLMDKGYWIVYTPYAMLYHHESATRGRLHPPRDEAYMMSKWKNFFVKGDPFYNPNLTLLKTDYSIAFQASRTSSLAVLLDFYRLSPDLQKTYPEAQNGDYQRLIDWAATIGVTVDGRIALQSHGTYHGSAASSDGTTRESAH
jgi:GT2 family glycosyltransferase